MKKFMWMRFTIIIKGLSDALKKLDLCLMREQKKESVIVQISVNP